MKRPLWLHQRDPYYFTGQVTHPALFLDMRLGKTLITIRRILSMGENAGVSTLIVAPYSALYGWRRELELEGVPPSDITELYGARDERYTLLCKGIPFCLINKEGFLALPEIAQRHWDVVVCDESTFLKNPKSKVSKFFCHNFRNVYKRFILTGTPAPETELDLFQQLYFLDPSILGFKNYWEFRHAYFQETGMYDYTLMAEGRCFLQTRLKKYCYSLSRRDVGMDVRKIYERRLITLPPAVRKAYNTVEDEFILELKGKVIDSTIFAMEKFIWLRRICGGFYQGREVHNEKMKVLAELLTEELHNDQVVIWCAFIEELKNIGEMLVKMKIPCDVVYGDVPPEERTRRMVGFQAGSSRVLICQPECFKHGTDLSCADTEIYYSSPLGLETRLQSEDRLVNISTKNPALIIDLLVYDSIEEEIYEALQRKETRQELVKRFMKRRCI
jgi:SNF2 family DNA or RNA helicase